MLHRAPGFISISDRLVSRETSHTLSCLNSVRSRSDTMPKYQATSQYYPAVGHPPQRHPRDYASFDVVPASGALGAEVLGLDVRGMDKAAQAEFETALTDHLVLFVRDQDLDPEELRGFAKRFGKPVSYPTSVPMPGFPEVTEFRSEPDTTYNFGGSWHTDSMFLERPPKFTILYTLECPAVGGDTSYANQYLAWDALPEELRAEVDGKLAINSSILGLLGMPKTDDPRANPVTYQKGSSDAWKIENAHPIARTHPVTGRKALYVTNGYTAHFVGMTQAESLPVLRRLWDHAVLPNFTCRFKWAKGTLAIWDNRCCMHFPHNDYVGQTRAMRRVIVEGERPE